MSDTDHELLRQFTHDHAQAAFTALVQRHVNLVYSAALRQVRSPQLAEEVAQSAFADLAREAAQLKPDTILTAWLYAVARRTAIDVVRQESRRQLREQIAVEMNAMNATDDEWTQIEPLLDDAMAALDATDRTAILLRYFENKNLRDVGLALGTSDDAAQKRVSRAVEQLRAFFAKRGTTVGASGLAVVISANAVQAAPAGLAATISAAGIAGATATTALIMTTLQKLAVTAALTVSVGVGIYEAKQAHDARSQVQALRQQQAPLVEQVQQLQKERDSATNQLAGLNQDLIKANKNHLELLKLRGEVGMLRSQFAALQKMTNESQTAPSEVLIPREFKVDAKAFRKKLEAVMQPPANTTTAKIASDYFATKGINLDSPKSISFADTSGALFVHTTEPDLATIEKLLGELIPLHRFQVHIKARFIELPKETFAEFSGLFNAKGSTESGLVGISNDEQFRKTLQLLEAKDGVETLGEPEVTTTSERQTQMRMGDQTSGGPIIDLIPHLLTDGYTIRLRAMLVFDSEQLSAQANVWDNQTLILSKTEKTNPEKQILVLITTTLVDEAGNRVYTEEDLPFAQSGVPAQESFLPRKPPPLKMVN